MQRGNILEQAFVEMINRFIYRTAKQRGDLRKKLDNWANYYNGETQNLNMVVKSSNQDDRWFVLERPDKERLLTVFLNPQSGCLSVDFSPKMLVQELIDATYLLDKAVM